MTLDEVRNMLQQVEAELSTRELRRAIKGSLNKEAKRVRRSAASYLRSSAVYKGGKLHNASAVAKGIRAKVYKDYSGFIVAANPYKKVGFHKNRRGLLKPVLMWANMGTQERTRKGAKGSNGSMAAIDFIKKAENQAVPSSVRNIVVNYQNNVVKIIRRHGGN